MFRTTEARLYELCSLEWNFNQYSIKNELLVVEGRLDFC